MAIDYLQSIPSTDYQIRTFESPTLSPTSIMHNGREYALFKTDEKKYGWIDRITLITLTIFSVGIALIFKSVRQNWTMLLNNKKYEIIYKAVDAKPKMVQGACKNSEEITALAHKFKENDDSLSLESLKKACVDLSKKTLKLDGTAKTQALFLVSIYSEIENRTQQTPTELDAVVDIIVEQIIKSDWKTPIGSVSDYLDQQIRNFLQSKIAKIPLPQPTDIVQQDVIQSLQEELQNADRSSLTRMVISNYPTQNHIQQKNSLVQANRDKQAEIFQRLFQEIIEKEKDLSDSQSIQMARKQLKKALAQFSIYSKTEKGVVRREIETEEGLCERKEEIQLKYQQFVSYYSDYHTYLDKYKIEKSAERQFMAHFKDIWRQISSEKRSEESMNQALHRLFDLIYSKRIQEQNL